MTAKPCARLCMSLLAGALGTGACYAEATTVTIGETFGLTHLPSYVIVDKQLIQKEAKVRGLPPIKVNFKQVSNGNVVSDLLLSGQANVAMSGVVPFISLWDKVRKREPVKGIAALAQCNIFLMTADPKIKSIRDYKSTDRIAMTDVATTTFALLLKMEAAKLYGWRDRNYFEPMSVPMSNGEATEAMLSGNTVVKSHMTVLPYSTVEYQTGRIHPVFSSKDLLGSPITATMAFTTVKFHDENPKLYAAIAAAYEDAVKFIRDHPRQAAEIYVRHEPQKNGVPFVLKLMNPNGLDQLTYTTTPRGVKAFADFMAKAGLIKRSVPSWKDLFFDNLKGRSGS